VTENFAQQYHDKFYDCIQPNISIYKL